MGPKSGKNWLFGCHSALKKHKRGAKLHNCDNEDNAGGGGHRPHTFHVLLQARCNCYHLITSIISTHENTSAQRPLAVNHT